MRHRIDGRTLGRTPSHRGAMMKNMACSLIRYEAIETTLPKAKELRRVADKLVTMGKKGDIAARRRAFDLLRDRDMVKKLFDVISPRFVERNGGYTRIVRTRIRQGDGAVMAMIEYLDRTVSDEQAPVEAAPEKKKGGILKKVMDKGVGRKSKSKSVDEG
ncbi:MAG: 50S ribosomal protein L17 [bacterium]|nr:50S ribosomal protein L17 [bacterium]